MWFIQLRMLQSGRLMYSSCMLFCCCNCFSCNDTFEGMQTKYNSMLLLWSACAGEFTCVQTDKIFPPLSSVYSHKYRQWWDTCEVGVKFVMCVGEFLHKHKHTFKNKSLSSNKNRMHLCASCCNVAEWISVQTETIPFVIATNIHTDFYLCVSECVFTSAMLELHLLFIRVLLSFDISTVPEKEKHSWIMIPYINQTTLNRLFLAPHRHQYSFMACLWMIIYTWVFVYMCNCTQEFDTLNLWYFQENPVLHRAQPIAVCMNK